MSPYIPLVVSRSAMVREHRYRVVMSSPSLKHNNGTYRAETRSLSDDRMIVYRPGRQHASCTLPTRALAVVVGDEVNMSRGQQT
jgi:hypothetical protein